MVRFEQMDKLSYKHPRRLVGLSMICLSAFFTNCGVPDINDQQVLFEAKANATPLPSLNRKLMYGMIQLYVDADDAPFNGWVKQDNPEGKIEKIGYLEDGQKEGTWLSWYRNGQLESKINWHNDQYVGHFQVWHPNGEVKALGQTKDGEVDGKWLNFYQTGILASRSMSNVGLAISSQTWTPDGQLCKKTNLVDGNGTVYQYEENGSVHKVTFFQKGIGTILPPQHF